MLISLAWHRASSDTDDGDVMSQTMLEKLGAGDLVSRISYAEFLAGDYENPHVEWVDGRMVEMAPISDEHEDVGRFLGAALRSYVEERGLGVIRGDPFQMKTASDLPGRAPDLIFISTANLPRLKRTYLKGPADLVVEIISPESRGRDRGDKFFEYEKGGVPEYWLIDPERKQAEFYLLDSKRIYKLANLDAKGIFHSKALPGVWVDPDWFWRKPLPTLLSVQRKWKLIK
jgi:Uma2 family endonuclease